MANQDEALRGNERIEEYLELLRKEPSDEVLAALLTAIRRRMKEGGQFVVAVVPDVTENLRLHTATLTNGEKWFLAFTSFDEEMKGDQKIMSMFMADIEGILKVALQEESVQGVLLNPWGNPLKMNKELMKVILG